MNQDINEVPYPYWVYDPTPEKFVEWLDAVHGMKLDPSKLDTDAIERIAKARLRDASLTTIASMGENRTVDKSAIYIMVQAAKDGSHHLTEGEFETPLEWFMSKVESNEWSEGMKYELQGVMNVVMPAFRAVGLNDDDLMKLTDNPSKARACVTHMRDLYKDLEKKHDDYTAASIENMYHDAVDPNLSVNALKAKLSKIVVPDPVVVEEAWTSESTSIVAIYFTDQVQRKAFKLLLDKLPNEYFQTDLVTMAGNVIGMYEGDIS